MAQSPTKIDFDNRIVEDFPLINFPDEYKDSIDLHIKIVALNRQFHDIGYLAVNISTSEIHDSIYKLKIEPGKQFSWLKLDPGNVPKDLLESIGYNPELFSSKPVHYTTLAAMMHRIVDHYANHGYPFASIRLDSISLLNHQLKGKLALKKNKIFQFEKINLISREVISKTFLEHFLNIELGKNYDQSKVDAIPERIKSLTFVRIDKNPSVDFKGNKAVINIYLEPKISSRFDLLIGLIPDNSIGSGIRITGDVAAEMHNKLGQGEYAGFRYKNINQSIQELSLDINYPFLLNLPFGIESSFNLYSDLTKNRDLDFDLGISYQYKNNTQFSIYWDYHSSRLISIDTLEILNLGKLPSNLDVHTNGIGISFQYRKLNYNFNPRSGLNLKISGAAALKSVLQNQEITSLKSNTVDFSESYDSIQDGYQFKFKTLVEYYIPIAKLFALKLANSSGVNISQHALYRNEAFRIGGSKILRGFDEESMYTHAFSTFTMEGRMLITTNSYFFLFGDLGLANVLVGDEPLFDTPYGFGAGLSFDTGSGILLISAAVGSQMSTPPDFTRSKIHVGYVSLF